MKILAKQKKWNAKNGTRPFDEMIEEISRRLFERHPTKKDSDEGFPFEESKKKRAPLRLHLFVARKNGEKSRNAKGRSVG